MATPQNKPATVARILADYARDNPPPVRFEAMGLCEGWQIIDHATGNRVMDDPASDRCGMYGSKAVAESKACELNDEAA